MKTPSPLKRLMIKPLTVMFDPISLSPYAPEPAEEPLSSIIGLLEKPGWVVPSIVSGFSIPGRWLLGEMVLAPEPTLKLIVSAADVLFASRIAWRSEPEP